MRPHGNDVLAFGTFERLKHLYRDSKGMCPEFRGVR